MDHMSIKRAVVIGTGMMGPGIAATLGKAGIEVTIMSRSEEGARQGIEKALAFAPEAIIYGSTDLDAAVGAAQLVIESAPEDMEFKQGLFERLDRIAPESAILGSNTSGLSITGIASRARHPERI